jgi:hypothetical protein
VGRRDLTEPARKYAKGEYMSKVFIAFAVEDKTYRDFLVGQAKLDRSPFEFTDMSAQEQGREMENELPRSNQGLRRRDRPDLEEHAQG